MPYTPTFIDGVLDNIFNVDPVTHVIKIFTSPVNPIYCLSNDPKDQGSAQAFVQMFPQFQATISLDHPEGPGFFGGIATLDGSFEDGAPAYSAPFIVWSVGGRSTGPMNAGVMANIFNHGYPEVYASGQVIAAITSQLGF